METTTYTLPAHWASALFNGDLTGLDDADEESLMRLIAGEGLPDPIGIVGDDPEHGPEASFVTYHDARPYGVLACDCLEYIFPAD
jgi:hypothetical protein